MTKKAAMGGTLHGIVAICSQTQCTLRSHPIYFRREQCIPCPEMVDEAIHSHTVPREAAYISVSNQLIRVEFAENEVLLMLPYWKMSGR